MRYHIHLGIRHTISVSQDISPLPGHHNHAVTVTHQFLHHSALGGIWMAQHGVQGGHNRHPHFLQQGKQMTPRSPSINTELMLHAEDIGIVEIQEIRRATVGVEILFQKLEAHTRGIIIPLLTVIDGSDKTVHARGFRRHSLREVMGECSNSTESWEIISQKGDTLR